MSARACPGEVWLGFTGESIVPRHQVSCRVLTFCENDRSGCSDDRVGFPTLGTLVPCSKISDPLQVHTESRVENSAPWCLHYSEELIY